MIFFYLSSNLGNFANMTQEYQIRVLPQVAYTEENIKQYIAEEKGLDVRTLYQVRVLKRSIDARQRQIFVNLKVRAYINEFPQEEEFVRTDYPNVERGKPVIVVGEGPGGLFAALRLIEKGLRPIVLERGKNVRERKKDLALITKTQKIDALSNYSFGEGGAGAYSDGKLYTRSKKRGSVEKILNVFCQHGASASILADAHPHIGTDKLPRVIENMRNTILKSGGEVHFLTKMTRLLIAENRVIGVEAVDLQNQCQLEFRGPVILATGHSARDVYRYLNEAKVEIEAKGIAVGVRLEHPSELIDQIQYHNKNGRGKYLPAAEYSFVTQVDGVNGMSPSNRGTAWSNSGMVVEMHPEDCMKIVGEDKEDALSVMRFQEQLEKTCWQQGNMKQTAPAQRMADFVSGRLSYDLPKSSYAPGLISSPLHFWLPSFVSKRLQAAFKVFGKNAHGFLTNEAVMIAAETRTSSPVRIIRDRDTLQHVRLQGLFPCGEGAGYAGGIVSAGIDGERCAEMAALYVESL